MRVVIFLLILLFYDFVFVLPSNRYRVTCLFPLKHIKPYIFVCTKT